jgi:TAG lipase / steryl ester hydrolase / phospholipase A2 / LPA acyltransferase
MIFTGTRRHLAAMDAATTYEEWKHAAIAYDEASGLVKWKNSDVSKHFDYASIRRRLNKLRRLRRKKDCAGILFALNEGIHGNIDGMGHGRLYNKACFGTKRLINEYVDEVVKSLDLLASDCADDIPVDRRLDFFRRAQHCYGCSALMMSGAGSLLFFHIGVVKTLWEYGLLPAILSGSSGGAFVGSIVSTNAEKDLARIFEPENLVYEIERDERLFRHMSAFTPDIADIDDVREAIYRVVPDITSLEALERSGRHLNVSIAAAEKHQTSRLLNAITTPNVYVREAVMASAAVPGFFPPVRLAAKNDAGRRQAYMPSRRWVDGSISHDIPAKRLARVYGANHFIVSQVNPHVFPFVTDTESSKKTLLSTLTAASKATTREWINATASIMERPLMLNPIASRLTNVALSVINQDYIGDVNILPQKLIFNPMRLLAHRSVDEIIELIRMGERATWPKLEQIRVQTKIGRKLDDILAKINEGVPGLTSSIARSAKAS